VQGAVIPGPVNKNYTIDASDDATDTSNATMDIDAKDRDVKEMLIKMKVRRVPKGPFYASLHGTSACICRALFYVAIRVLRCTWSYQLFKMYKQLWESALGEV
jgi:hypothetical protein